MADISSALSSAAQTLGVKVDEFADLLKDKAADLAKLIKIKGQAQISHAKEAAKKYVPTTILKTKGKKLEELVSIPVAAEAPEKPEEAEAPEEVVKEEEKVEARTFKQVLEEVKDNKERLLTRIAGDMMKLSEKEPELTEEELSKAKTDQQKAELRDAKISSQIVDSLTGSEGSFKANPLDAVSSLQIAAGYLSGRINYLNQQIDELNQKIKKAKKAKKDTSSLERELRDREQQIKTEQGKLARLNQALTNVMTAVQGRESSTPFISIGRSAAYSQKLKSDALSKFPGKTESDIETAAKELHTKINPSDHIQYCRSFGKYNQLNALFAVFNRMASEAMSRGATNIEPGLLYSLMKVIRNNNGLMKINDIIKNQLIWVMKEWDDKIGRT